MKNEIIFITKIVNLSAIEMELGLRKQTLKRTGNGKNKYFPKRLRPQMEKLNELISEWIKETKEI